ncbi:hypothetical protein B0181_08980 [Moraxella caviae]|nr:lytic transglycosylase domain-containing protein [Moraxella caviae]OOR88075.1 hypothetical protein B0181_08980 [Moraxella caviae]
MKRFIPALIALSASSASLAAQVYVYDDGEQKLLTNIEQNTSGSKKFTQISMTQYPSSKLSGTQTTSTPSNFAASSLNSGFSSGNSTYDHMIIASAARHGVDPALVKAIMHTESGFNSYARSRVGAMGLMQLMPGTARHMGVVNAWDPAQNIEGGVKYLAFLQERFSDRDHIIAAYNAGHGNVRKYGGIPPFRETRNYVRKVNERYNSLYRHDAALTNGYHLAMNTTRSGLTGGVTGGVTTRAVNGSATNYATPQNPNLSKSGNMVSIQGGN